MATKYEILDKYIPCQCWPAKDGGRVYNVSCPQHSQDPESAMDEYAAKMASDFGVWIGRNHYEHDAHGWYWFGTRGLITVREDISQTTDELYKLFLQSIQQP